MSDVKDTILVLFTNAENQRTLKIIGGFAARTLQSDLQYLDLSKITRQAVGVNFTEKGMRTFMRSSGNAYNGEVLKTVAAAIRTSARKWPVDLILADLPENSLEAGLEMSLAAELNVDFGFLRYKPVDSIKRVVITTGGGPHALVGLKYGKQTARSLNAETIALRIVRPAEMYLRKGSEQDYCREVSELISIQTAMAGVDIPVKTVVADSVEEAILNELDSNDMLIMGITSKWRYTSVSGSLPAEIARKSPCSVMVVYSAIKEPLPLEEVFWERNIILNPAFSDRWELLSNMVDRLIDDRQLPEEMRAVVIASVYNREFESPTATGRGIAIPHAALPDFEGTVGCIATFDEPIDYDGKMVDVVFLLITPENDYQEYLSILGKIAKLAMHSEFLKKMKAANHPADVVRILTSLRGK